MPPPMEKNSTKRLLASTSVGNHKKGYPNQRNKNRKKEDKADHPRSPGLGRGFRLARPLGLRRKLRLARPLGLGRKVRLARPLSGSGANTATPKHHLGARLPMHDDRTFDMTYAVIPIPRQGMAATVPTNPATVQPYLFHYTALPLSL
jgi:hypothetical protein